MVELLYSQGRQYYRGGGEAFRNVVTATQEIKSIRTMREEEKEAGGEECIHYNVVVIADAGVGGGGI